MAQQPLGNVNLSPASPPSAAQIAASHPTDRNKAWGATAGTIGTGALVGTVIWQIVTQVWPDFHPTPEMVLLTTTLATAVGAWFGAYVTKHST